jgi:transposase
MKRPECIPEATWEVIPPEAQAVLAAVIAALEIQIADLKASLKQDSSNSSRPPSSDPPGREPAPPRKPSGRKRGGQPGHRRNDRIRLEPDEVVDVKPDRCRRCGESLEGDDPGPIARQVFEVPDVRPHVVEYRLHRLTCPRCGASTCGAASAGAGVGYGPRAQAVCAVLAGEGRMSKRRVAGAMRGLFGLPIGPASVCELERRTAEALAPIHAELLGHIRELPANVDETSWPEGRRKGWLWAAVAKGLGVFRVAASRSRDAFEALMGRSPPAVVTSDRYSAYSHLPPEKRQACWAHLRRDFRAMIDRDDVGSAIGEELLLHADVLFDAWPKVRAGVLARRTFGARTLPWLRREVRELLGAGTRCGSTKTAATCREILKVEGSLWTFATAEGVEPTNNDAERALRHAVCWRKTSFGTDSADGSRFVERMLTTVESCRRQGRDLLAFLVQAVEAHRSGATPPSLISAEA